MPEPWLTFAPIESIHLPSELTLPCTFNEHVSIQAVPEWVLQAEESDPFREKLRSTMESGEGHCIAAVYEADTLGSRQQTAANDVFSVHLALWLIRPTALSFHVIAHARKHDTEWNIRSIAPYSPAIPLSQYAYDHLVEEDFAKAKTLFGVLQSVSGKGPVRMAAQAAKKALIEGAREIRFLLLWIALESLFGPEDGREVSFRLSQRIALFLETDRLQGCALFSRIKKSYDWRSKIVHGLRVAKLKNEQSQNLLVELEQLVRRSLSAVLATGSIASTFDGKEREKYLDNLVFG